MKTSANIADIISRVKICMDEISGNDAEFDIGEDDSQRDTIIKSKIIDALRFIYANADLSVLEPSETDTENITVAEGVGTYQLPDNYIRLVSVKARGWSRALGGNDIILWDDPAYAMLKDEYCTGTNDRPKVALVIGIDGKKHLELYPCPIKGDDDEEVESAQAGDAIISILTEPTLTNEEGEEAESITYPQMCEGAMIYYIAGLTYVTYGDEARARMMFDQANDMVGMRATIQSQSATNQLTQQ